MRKLIFLLWFYLFAASNIFSQTPDANTTPGTLDNSFGDSGIVITSVNPDGFNTDYCYSIALQKNGKIIAAGGGGYKDQGGFLLVRYNTSGSIDSSFGLNGRVVTEPNDIILENIYATAVLDNDKILAAGIANDYNTVAVARYEADGKLDSSFGTNGITLKTFSTYTYVIKPAMALQPDGKIVVTGNYQTNENDIQRGYIIRYNADGSIDEDFGEKGVKIISFDNPVTIRAIEVQPDGKILIGATYGKQSPQPQFLIARYLSDGSKDLNFGTRGQAKDAFIDNVTDLYTFALQDDGKIIAAGMGGMNDERGFGLMRFDESGNLDMSFGENGKTVTLLYTQSEVRNILIQPDKKIIATGSQYTIDGRDGEFVLARYSPNGIIDESFGNNGVQTTKIPDNARGYSSVLQEDGKIIVGGSTYNNTFLEDYFALARYIGGDGVLPITYNYIKASKYNNSVLLSWQTAQENNNSFFAVEHAANNSNFTEIARVASLGNGAAQQYAYTHKAPAEGNNFYRLKQANANGEYAYSKTVSIYYSANGNIKLHPNPANNEIVLDGLDAAINNSIIITSADGKTVLQKNIQNSSCTIEIKNFTAGTYFIKVQNNLQTTVLKFVKQ